jgi:1-deoxy-D-xylulose-5-phosphate reductoisomerase
MINMQGIPQRIALMGSTGSIGTQSLDVISRFPGEFKVEVLAAGNNIDLLTQQALRFQPDSIISLKKTLKILISKFMQAAKQWNRLLPHPQLML